MDKKALHKTKILLFLIFISSIFLCFFSINNITVKAEPNTSNINDIYVRLKYGKAVWEYRYPEIKYCGGFDYAAEKSFTKDYRGRLKGQNKPLFCSYRLTDAENKLKIIAKHIDTDPVKAEVSYNPHSKKMFKIKDDVKGKSVNIKQLLASIEKSLLKGKSVDVEIVPDTVNAEVTTVSIKRALKVRGEFSTDYSFSIPERKHNIKISLREFNGLIVAPDETVSFNDVVGERTAEKGYKTSKIILNGEFIEGIGGGVCQSSTTIYNALILSDVKILEYHHHTLSVSYVPPSFDAMVNISTADLKFKNTTGNFLFFQTSADDNKAYVKIYGEQLNFIIKRKSTVLKEYEKPKEEVIIDIEGKYKNLFEGERQIILHSKPKKESMGELLYYKDDKLFKTVLLRKDTYSQLIGKEIIGTAKKPE